MNPIHQTIQLLRNELGVVLSSTLARLLLAAILGGIIGLERQLRHKPAGLRTNMFICFGAAMFTVLSRATRGHADGQRTDRVADHPGYRLHRRRLDSAREGIGDRADHGGYSVCGGVGGDGSGRRLVFDGVLRHSHDSDCAGAAGTNGDARFR